MVRFLSSTHRSFFDLDLLAELAFSTCLMALGLSTGYILRFGVESFTFFYDHWVGFVSAALSMSFFQGVLWYALSFQGGKLLALGGNSGNFIYDVRAVDRHKHGLRASYPSRRTHHRLYDPYPLVPRPIHNGCPL